MRLVKLGGGQQSLAAVICPCNFPLWDGRHAKAVYSRNTARKIARLKTRLFAERQAQLKTGTIVHNNQ